MENLARKEHGDYSILFEQLNKIKQEKDYTLMKGTMVAVSELQDPIEKLRQIVMDKEDCFYNTITTAY
jgi:hypothetical protein